ncbi:MAG: ATP-dependent DNA ligase, partial [Polyangiales bacterium]
MKRLARALEQTRLTRSRIGKEETLAAVFREIGAEGDDVALAMAARLAVGLALGIEDPRPLGVGWVAMAEICVAQTGWPDWMVRECSRACGDLAEAWWRLVDRMPEAHRRPGIALPDVSALFDSLAGMGNRAAKREKLEDAFARATPLETKYLAKAILRSLRIGAMGGVLEAAIARAFGLSLEAVQRASAIVTDPGALAVLARDDRLGEARVEIGRPIAFMLATPIETIASAIDPAMHVVEDKIDGVRAQLHKRGDEVSIFARGLERITDAYPEIVDAFRFVPGSIALDGEIVAVTREMRPRPFQALQQRLRKSATPELASEVPVAFFAYDLLADDEGDHLALPWKERRARLEAWAEL